MSLSSSIVFLEESEHAGVVFESNSVGFRELSELWNVSPGSCERAKDVFRKRDASEFEVGFEEKIGGVVECPFTGEWSFGAVR